MQIVDFHKKCEQVFTTRRPFREALLRNVTEIIKNLWPAVEVLVYGSYATRLHLGSSDIDLVVKAGLPHTDTIANPEIYCGQLANHFDSLLSELSWIMEIKVLQHLPIPLVKVAYDSIMSFMFSFLFASVSCLAAIIS
jgi:DNA polymerase sigma